MTGHWHHDFQFLRLTVLQFLERKNRFREDCSCFLDNANVNRKRYSWQLTVSENEFFALQITDNSFGKEKNREDSVIVPTHYLLLENLLIDCNVLIINTPRKVKQPKETNWKQKFQKLQNENICLTSVNTEMNGNFHFLSSYGGQKEWNLEWVIWA